MLFATNQKPLNRPQRVALGLFEAGKDKTLVEYLKSASNGFKIDDIEINNEIDVKYFICKLKKLNIDRIVLNRKGGVVLYGRKTRVTFGCEKTKLWL